MIRLFFAFLKIGAVSFGGGWTVVGLIRDEAIGMGLMTEESFRQAVGIAQVTPGPVALNTATLSGFALAGVPGALLATLAVVLVPVAAVSLLAFLSTRVRPGKGGLKEGLRMGALAMTAMTAWSLAAPEGLEWRLFLFSAVAALVTLKTKFSPALLIISCGAANLLIGFLLRLA